MKSHPTSTGLASKFLLHYPLIALTGVNFFFYADRYILFILVEPIKKEFSLTDGQIGMLTGLAFAVTYCLFAIPLGRLVDRSGRITIISVAAVAWSFATAMFSFSQNFIQMVLLRSGSTAETFCYINIQHSIFRGMKA